MESPPGNDNPLLDLAASYEEIDAVRELLAAGHSPNRPSKYPALVRAVRRDHLEIARLLLENGADPFWRDRFGHPLLGFAKSREMFHLLEAFGVPRIPVIWVESLEKQVSFEEIRERHQSPLDKYGFWDVVDAIYEPGDELWSYSNPPQSHNPREVHKGYALVRNGIPIRTLVWMRCRMR